MGCICSKGGPPTDHNPKNHSKGKKRKAKRHARQSDASVEKDGAAAEINGGGRIETDAVILPDNDPGCGPATTLDETPVKPQLQRKLTKDRRHDGGLGNQTAKISRFGNAERGAQVVAGWPPWLTSVAGEAVSGWVPRKADSFEKLEKIGQGTYSSVYKARDLETHKTVALKKVRFANMDPESVRFMAREILILRRLDHPNVMKLESIVTSRVSGSLYLVFEYMEHDLAGLAATPGVKFTESQIKCYMQQLLRGLEHCHGRGVLHRDIKGSNLLISNNGNLKIGDFGLATFFQPCQKQPLTSRVVTLWYRPPELLLGATDYGAAVDLWSSGCILAELYAGKPIMPGRTEVEQLHKIFKLCGSPSEEYWKKSKLPHATIFKPQQPYKRCVAETFKDFPSDALAILDVLLAIEPDGRGTACSALQHDFFMKKPLPCDPSTLPKYPPSKEFDAKLRNEELRRQKAALGVEGEQVSAKKGPKQSKVVPARDSKSDMQITIQKRYGNPNALSNTEKLHPEEHGGSDVHMVPPKGVALNVLSHSGQSIHPMAFGSSRNMNVNETNAKMGLQRVHDTDLRKQRSYTHRGAAQLSRYAISVAVRGGSRLEISGETSVHPQWEERRFNAALHCLDEDVKREEQPSGKQPAMGTYARKPNRMHFSGPLTAAGENLDEMLKEHEKHIQQAVRKSRLQKTVTNGAA